MSQPIQYLIGTKVYLRPLEPSDTEAMVQMGNNDQEMRRLTGTQSAFTRAQIETYIERQWQDDTRVGFGIVSREDDTLVGEIVINDIYRNNRSANLRIAIADAHTGKGYGTQAMRLMLDHGFGILNLHRIELEVYSINDRATHVYEKVGFRREGVKRQSWYYNHQYYDAVMMSILEDEYRAASQTV